LKKDFLGQANNTTHKKTTTKMLHFVIWSRSNHNHSTKCNKFVLSCQFLALNCFVICFNYWLLSLIDDVNSWMKDFHVNCVNFYHKNKIINTWSDLITKYFSSFCVLLLIFLKQKPILLNFYSYDVILMRMDIKWFMLRHTE
jgi:hypothetical protein